MKKILFPILTILLTACSSSSTQVTATVTVTSPPTATVIPLPTLHPQFIAIQSQVAASGERFTLLSDGTIQETTAEGAVTVPGLSVDKNGVMTIIVNGETITLDPSKVIIDDETGFSYPGYEQDANGEWVEVQVGYTMDQLGKMSEAERLGAAPDKDGLTKYQPPNRLDTVLYRSPDGGGPEWGYDLKTGEMVAVMEISFNPDKPIVLDPADFDSGKWLNSERLMCDRLPDTAQVPEWRMSTYPGYGGFVVPNGDPMYVVNPDTRPQSICSMAKIELDFGAGSEDFVLMGVVTKSADGSQRILHFLREEKAFIASKNFLLKNRGFGFLTNLVDESTDVQKNTGYTAFRDVVGANPIMLEFGQQLAETGVITKEMEQTIFALESKPLGGKE